MRKMTTIEDLEWAMKNEPELIERYKKAVTIVPDLKEHLKWMYDNNVSIKVRSTLKRRQGRTLGIHPSSACKPKVCKLKLYYECVEEIEPKRTYDPKMQEIWDLGTLMHDRLQTFLSDMYGDQFESELALSIPELHIIGHTDGLFIFEAHDGLRSYRFILEIKTIKEGKEKSSYGWASVQHKPMKDNVRQAHFYMKAKNVPFAIIFYISKNTGEFLEHAVTFDPKIWAELEETIADPIEAAYGDTNVNVKASPGWNCRWCDYEHGCAAAKRKKGGRRAKGSRTWKRKKK
jgi:CRISPR/Cas system-associated exonuclease Cas4 (RecB family)